MVTKGAWPARWLARLRDRLEGAAQSRTHGVVSELFRKFPYSLLFFFFSFLKQGLTWPRFVMKNLNLQPA